MYTVYVLTSVLELMSGPRIRMSFVSSGRCPMVKNGCTKTTGPSLVKSTHPEAARLKSIANSNALVEAYVGVMVG